MVLHNRMSELVQHRMSEWWFYRENFSHRRMSEIILWENIRIVRECQNDGLIHIIRMSEWWFEHKNVRIMFSHSRILELCFRTEECQNDVPYGIKSKWWLRTEECQNYYFSSYGFTQKNVQIMVPHRRMSEWWFHTAECQNYGSAQKNVRRMVSQHIIMSALLFHTE